MSKLREVYRCPICGNMVEVLNPGGGTLVCCGKPMMLLEENTSDGAHEKHVPVVKTTEGGYHVRVGSVEHPMLDEHSIQWVELLTPDMVMRKELKPGDKPEATFLSSEKATAAREYCNLHGLWKGEIVDIP